MTFGGINCNAHTLPADACVSACVCMLSCPCRLRRDMESQAAALRSAVESQGREVAALRATAAVAEAESAAAKAELAQVCGGCCGAQAYI